MQEKILSIDTSNNLKTVVGLTINGHKYQVEETLTKPSQNLLALVQKILQKHKIDFRDLTAIEVNTGPGSFTGLRVGVAVANTLGSLLDIPVNNKTVGEIIIPHY